MIFFKVSFEFNGSEKKSVTMKVYKDINIENFQTDMTLKVRDVTEQNFRNFYDAFNGYNNVGIGRNP